MSVMCLNLLCHSLSYVTIFILHLCFSYFFLSGFHIGGETSLLSSTELQFKSVILKHGELIPGGVWGTIYLGSVKLM